MHFDTDAAIDGRKITAIWYLNAEWLPEFGGELRLCPFFPGSRPIDIAPINDRLVLFPSHRMLHRVLPSARERFCATIWLSEGRGRTQGMQTDERAMARTALASGAPLSNTDRNTPK